MVTIREAQPADVSEMAHIQTEALDHRAGDHYTDDQIAKLLRPKPDQHLVSHAEDGENGRHVIVAESEGTVVGWGSLHLKPGVLASTYVHPAHTGEGIGRAIVKRLEAVARENGIEMLKVPAPLHAVGFFEALGYTRNREIDASDPDESPIPGVELKKNLQ